MVIKSFRFVITGRLPGRNEQENAARSNKFAGAKVKKDATELVHFSILEQQIRPVFNEPVNVSVIYFDVPNKGRRRDPDNIMGGIKYILDGMVRAGVIPDDTCENIDTITQRVYCQQSKPHIVVYVTGRER